MSELFNHTEQPTDQLVSRLQELSWQEQNVLYSESRRRQLGHEAACLVFEIMNRDVSVEAGNGAAATI